MPASASFTLTFSAASGTAVANYQAVPVPVGDTDRAAKAMRLFVSTNAALSTNTQTVRLLLRDANGLTLGAYTANVTQYPDTSTSLREDAAGTGGNFVGKVSWEETSTSIIDLAGVVGSPNDQTRSISALIGVPTLAAGIGSVVVRGEFIYDV